MKANETQKRMKIGIASTSSPIEPETFRRAVANLNSLGIDAKVPLDPSATWGKKEFGFCADTPKRRAAAFMDLIQDPEVSAIVSARGGYGTIEVLPFLDFDVIRSRKKPIIGFSDFTVLLQALWSKAQAQVIHGPSILSSFANYQEDAVSRQNAQSLLEMLRGSNETQATCEVLRAGDARGPMLAGNLTMLTTLIGTPWDTSYDGAVLVLEDTGEAPYRIHRALNQLRYAGKLKSLAGLVYGRFSKSDPRTGPTVEEVLRSTVNDILLGTDFPVLMGMPVGHEGINLPMSFGNETIIAGNAIKVSAEKVR